MKKGFIFKLKEFLIESLVFISGNLAILIVFLIVFFLFKEGIGLFNQQPLEEGTSIMLNPNNPIKELKPDEIKQIFEKDIRNWKDLGGEDVQITLFTLSDVDRLFTLEELGSSFENLPTKIGDYIRNTPGVIAVFPEKYLPTDIKKFHMKNISVEDFVGGKEWHPTASPAVQLGVLPIILGSLLVSLGAILFSLPIGLAVAIYMAELAPKKVYQILKPTIELLAGIPSVVFGFLGLSLLVPFVAEFFDLPVGETALSGSILLGIISLPTIITLAEDAMKSTPKELKESSYALGANKWQTISRVIIPYAKSGIISASLLGIGRAIGETMAVIMVTGNAAVIPYILDYEGHFKNPFYASVRTITATIASELGEAPQGGIHYQALFMLGCILFAITFLMNLIAEGLNIRKR